MGLEAVRGLGVAIADWMASHQAVVSVSIAVVGWLASHRLAIRAQRKSFINQITNDARKEIGEALREYESWCSSMSSRLWSLSLQLPPSIPPWPEERWQQTGRELIDLIWSKSTFRWSFAVEENEILFPELRRPREQLLDRQASLSSRLGAFLDTTWMPQSRKKGIEDAQAIVPDLREQQALVAYLHVYVQNLALGQMLRKRPVPAPRDVTLLRLIAKGSKLEFGPGQPLGRAAFVWRRLRYGRFRPILEEPAIPDQRRLFAQLRQVAKGAELQTADCWIQGEGQRMSAQILDARSGYELWLLASSTPEQIVAGFDAWTRGPARPKPGPQGPGQSSRP